MTESITTIIAGGLMALLQGITRLEASDDDDALRMCRTFIRASEIPAAVVGKDKKVIVCNRPMEEFLGRTQAQLQTLEFGDFTHPAYIKEDELYFEKVFSPTVEFDSYKLWKIWLRPDDSQARGVLEVYPMIQAGEVIFTLAIVHPDQEKAITEKMNELQSKDKWVQILEIFSGTGAKLKLALAAGLFILVLGLVLFALMNGSEILELFKPDPPSTP